MSSKAKTNVADVIRRLAEAKVINLDVDLKATLGAVSSISDEVDPIDFWCGTIRRPWVVIRPHVDFEETMVEMAQAIVSMKQQVGEARVTG
jgi:hypothetical protein